MNKVMMLAKMVGVAVTLSWLAGCSGLNQVVPDEVKYGQLYALDNALTLAGEACGDEERLFVVQHWAQIVHPSLSEHVTYLQGQEKAQAEAGRLLKQLSYLAGSFGTPSCENLRETRQTNARLIAALVGGPIRLASR